ncbi:MAG: class I SAM-dependent methyltransferase [Planctomycetes bacterium]|nr:class I SAM-dependent methyltransferase [Planctomycetota bacterium]
MTRHQDLILEQFAVKAESFATAPQIKNEEALRLLVQFSGATAEDTVLDVACGPGLVVCAFAEVVRHATGIDLTPAMIEKAKEVQAEKGLKNVTWQIGDVATLPFPEASFSIAVSRYSFHHFPEPRRVLAEMARVARAGGKVVIADVTASDDPAKADAFNRMERLRDPSHTRALPLAELQDLYREAGLSEPRLAFHRLEFEVESLLQQGSHPRPGDAEKVRQMFQDSLKDDAMGVGARKEGDEIHFRYPIVILVGIKLVRVSANS